MHRNCRTNLVVDQGRESNFRPPGYCLRPGRTEGAPVVHGRGFFRYILRRLSKNSLIVAAIPNSKRQARVHGAISFGEFCTGRKRKGPAEARPSVSKRNQVGRKSAAVIFRGKRQLDKPKLSARTSAFCLITSHYANVQRVSMPLDSK
jgi:hypothetical protein